MTLSQTATPRGLVIGPMFPYPPTSGGVKRTLRLLEAVERAGAEVHYFTLGSAAPDAIAALKERGWRVHLVENDSATTRNRLHQHVRLLPGRWSRNLATEVQRFAATKDVAFLQAEHIQYDAYLRLGRGVPRILSTHNVDSHIERGYARQLPLRSLAKARFSYRTYRYVRTEEAAGRFADAVVCVSEADAAYYRRYAGNVVVAPNGVDDAFFGDRPPRFSESEDVVFFGLIRYDPNAEGLARFLRDGWPHVVKRRPAARLLIAGDGGPELLPTHLDDAGVVVLGLVDDIARVVARARVVVVPVWRGGGTRLKVLEALAAGRPIVGTTLGVSGVGFEHGVHGLIVDDPLEMALAVAGLCEDRETAETLGAAGPALAESYRWQHALKPAESLYRGYVHAIGG